MTKKRKSIVWAVFLSLLTVSSVFASEKMITFDAGLSTGIPVYGDGALKSLNKSISENGHRIIIGTVADVNIKLSDEITFFFGNDMNFDFLWKDGEYSNHIDTAFFPGLKIYPGFGGLNFSCAYSLGTRWDFVSFTSEEDIDSSYWGNGFRLGVEYDFSFESNPYFPSAGIYYRLCPRGQSNWDNIFCVYCVAHF
ncbi:MAG: hypothetical protein MJ182_04370 [Treponema sp.]|nr:hypothetical protein [Treponema sp.]